MKSVILKTIGTVINVIGIISPSAAGKMALRLFSRPRRIRLKELEKDFLMTSFIEEVDYKEHHIMTYRWLGKKETVLLAHGWESNAYRWKPLIEKLKSLDYNVVALDAPAHGRSSGKTFNAVLYSDCIHIIAKKFKANIIVGHSVGGMAATFCQEKYKVPTVNKLILLGAPSNFVGVFNRYSKMMGYNQIISKAIDGIVLQRFNHEPEYFDAARLAESIDAKGLIIHDEYDKVIPYNDAEDFKTFYKKSKLITTKGFGHALKGEEVEDHIVEFINEVN